MATELLLNVGKQCLPMHCTKHVGKAGEWIKDLGLVFIPPGLAYRTVERAKEILGVTYERHGWGPGSTCYWRLPTEDGEAAGDHSTPSAPVALYEPGNEQ